MSLNQDRAAGSRRRRQGRKRRGRHNQAQDQVVEQPPALPQFFGCPIALDAMAVDGSEVNGTVVDGTVHETEFGETAVNDPSPGGPHANGNHVNGGHANGSQLHDGRVNGDQINGDQINGGQVNGGQPGGAHYDRPHLDFSALSWTTLNDPTSNGSWANGHTPNGHAPNGHTPNGHAPNGHTPNGHAPNGHSANGHAPNGNSINGHALNDHPVNGSAPNGSGADGSGADESGANGSGANGSGANGSGANGWAALSRVHGDFTADLGQLPVTWSPADPDAIALDSLLASAERFIRLFYRENQAGEPEGRIRQVRREIESTGTYRHKASELEFGARVAWRNSAKCIGRLYWRSLQVRDRREVREAADVAAESVMHLRKATNGGKIRPVITIFAPDAPGRPGPRILSPQLIRYAGYENADGTVTGDPAGVGITRLAQDLGWPGGQPNGRFDVLPLVIKEPGAVASLYELPEDVVLEVAISHPEYDWFADLGLRWHAVPVISDMYLEIGGIRYPAAPFNGWYMGTEIGSRDFGDAGRYDQLPVIAERMGLSTACDRNLWKDKAMTELNLAVLHSYDIAGVTIADHHTESSRFLQHLAKEERQGRACPADWTWIVPPATSSATPVFHRYYQNFDQSPNFYRHPPLES